MCGLVGFWHFRDQPAAVMISMVERMCQSMRMRGPDSYATWVSEADGFAVGHNRLAVVDLSPAGHQPMISANGRYVLVYNGEIYKTQSMREELIQLGVQFRGHSDTEVLLEGCAIWGVDATIRRCNGMFAFVLWDQHERRCFLVRDRLGVKPLYWGFHQGILFFGSQTGGFKLHPEWTPQVDDSVLVTFLHHGYLPGSQSIYQGIEQVKPGTVVEIRADHSVHVRKFWSLEQIIEQREIQFGVDPSTLTLELDALLRDAVKARMVADVPLGAFLSGGIDSSLIAALMQAQSAQPIQTFSIGFHEQDFNEAPYAKAVAQHLGTEHHEHYFSSADAMEVIPSLPEMFDEPFADSSQLPTYLVSKIARQRVTVALSGDGGDELFAGYTRYHLAQQIWRQCAWMPRAVRVGLAGALGRVKPAYWDVMAKMIPAHKRPPYLSDKMIKLANILPLNQADFYRNLVGLWPENTVLLKQTPYQFEFPSMNGSLNFIESMQFADTMIYLPDDILTKVDRASMAVSLEARVPFLDYRVVEWAWSLPMDMKIRSYQGKWLLRQVLKSYVPDRLMDRPKMGFGVPVGRWLRGPLKDWAYELLSPQQLPQDGLLNRELIMQRFQQHMQGQKQWDASLWTVLMFQAWKQRYL
jgi:asparagine synthase (glutamine-hydrolysing)